MAHPLNMATEPEAPRTASAGAGARRETTRGLAVVKPVRGPGERAYARRCRRFSWRWTLRLADLAEHLARRGARTRIPPGAGGRAIDLRRHRRPPCGTPSQRDPSAAFSGLAGARVDPPRSPHSRSAPCSPRTSRSGRCRRRPNRSFPSVPGTSSRSLRRADSRDCSPAEHRCGSALPHGVQW